MANQVFRTRDGTRELEVISLDGQPTFLIRDPRYAGKAQPPNCSGLVRVTTRMLDDGTVVFGPPTVVGLRLRGIELRDLTAAQ
jgi:hypothetical protein